MENWKSVSKSKFAKFIAKFPYELHGHDDRYDESWGIVHYDNMENGDNRVAYIKYMFIDGKVKNEYFILYNWKDVYENINKSEPLEWQADYLKAENKIYKKLNGKQIILDGGANNEE